MLEIDLDQSDNAILSAWIECGATRQIVIDRKPVKIEACADHGLLHIDVFGDNGDGRIAAISMINRDASNGRPLYARTTLLAQAGFHAGAYDPPGAHCE